MNRWNFIRFIFILFVCELHLTSCHQQANLKVVLSRFANNSVKEVIYLDLPITGDSIGLKEIYFENGRLQARGNYKKGEREGTWACYKKDGSLEWRGEYKNGKENGLIECFLENGSWRKMFMVNGSCEGTTTEYNIDTAGKEFWVYGQYKNNKEDSIWVKKNKQGRIISRGYYTDGKPDRYYETYYDNGVVFNKAFLRGGNMDSLKTFDSVGRILETKYYKDATLDP